MKLNFCWVQVMTPTHSPKAELVKANQSAGVINAFPQLPYPPNPPKTDGPPNIYLDGFAGAGVFTGEGDVAIETSIDLGL